MTQNPDDAEVRLRNYLSKKNHVEGNPIPNKEEKKEEKKVNDDYNEYDIHEEDTVDDRDW